METKTGLWMLCASHARFWCGDGDDVCGSACSGPRTWVFGYGVVDMDSFYGDLWGFCESLGDGFCMMLCAVCGVVSVVCDLIGVISLGLWWLASIIFVVVA